MVQYVQPEILASLCEETKDDISLGTLLVEVIASVLDNEVSSSRRLKKKRHLLAENQCISKFHDEPLHAKR